MQLCYAKHPVSFNCLFIGRVLQLLCFSKDEGFFKGPLYEVALYHVNRFGQAVDSLVFYPIAFLGVLPSNEYLLDVVN
jgi:hypothetical protein